MSKNTFNLPVNGGQITSNRFTFETTAIFLSWETKAGQLRWNCQTTLGDEELIFELPTSYYILAPLIKEPFKALCLCEIRKDGYKNTILLKKIYPFDEQSNDWKELA